MTNRVKFAVGAAVVIIAIGSLFLFRSSKHEDGKGSQSVATAPQNTDQNGTTDQSTQGSQATQPGAQQGSNTQSGSAISGQSNQGNQDSMSAQDKSQNPRSETATTSIAAKDGQGASTQPGSSDSRHPANVPAAGAPSANGSIAPGASLGNASVAGSNGVAGATGASGQVELKPQVATGCFEMAFKHRKLPTHTDADSCNRHKNRVQLAHDVSGLSSICVRVDGDAVAYEKIKGAPKELLIASPAGPDSKITVRYCLGKTRCAEDCKITKKKDSFLEAVGGVSDEKGSGEIAQWDAEGSNESDKKLVREVASEIAGLEADLKADKDEDAPVFTGWVGEPEAPACSKDAGVKHAQAVSPRS